jgi:hypothetical protein
MYLCTEQHPHIDSCPVNGLESARAYRTLFSLDAVLRSLTDKHSAYAEKARIGADMRVMRLRCDEPLPEVFQNAVAVVANMQKLAL